LNFYEELFHAKIMFSSIQDSKMKARSKMEKNDHVSGGEQKISGNASLV